jgi:3-oxoadipate enol-lactonase
MPFAHAADGTRIHYDVFGARAGEPLLLLQGLGADSRGWARQRRSLAARFRCIAVDNRGVGRSDKPDGPYGLEAMAADAVAVLDAVGVPSAHVMGASMGGVLAQILAVEHPHRVRSLVLACTACRHHPWRRELLNEWAEVADEQGTRALVDRAAKWLMGPRSRFRLWPVISVLGPLAFTVPPHAFVAQARAILDLDDGLRFELAGVEVPALVIVGSQDILTPLADSEELVAMIGDAELVVVTGGAHGFMVEHAHAFNRAVVDFLGRVGEEAATA